MEFGGVCGWMVGLDVWGNGGVVGVGKLWVWVRMMCVVD